MPVRVHHWARGWLRRALVPEELWLLQRARVPDEPAIAAAYAADPIARCPDSFVLTRIIGNDLAPRHAPGQSRENLRFVLENEEPLADCEKRWIVNRIADPAEEARILALLAEHRQPVLRIPFDPAEYARIGWDTDCLPRPGFLASPEAEALSAEARDRLTLALYRLKNNYVMNNNGARNAAIEDGRGRAKWILPWDGNCFLTAAAWETLRAAVRKRPHLPYFVVPMARIVDNAAVGAPPPVPLEEPQIVLRRDGGELFDPEIPYGRRPKVELLQRLGIPGKWDVWTDDPWDRPRRPRAREAGRFAIAGWVARLSSGREALERDDDAGFKDRGRARQAAIRATIDRLDAAMPVPAADPEGLLCYSVHALEAAAPGPLGAALLAEAGAALGRGPFSVVDKTTLPPSGDLHDYWHPAPYWWPNRLTPSGRPYRQRDGVRVPGTRLYEPESEKYDRTRLQRLFDDTTGLALAWRLGGGDAFAAHAARLIEAWFVTPATRMAPHARYAQVRLGWNRDQGVGTGIIEFKDFYYMLDAARLLEVGNALSSATAAGFHDWLGSWCDWLTRSPQGRRERLSTNNHGTCYALHFAAFSSSLGAPETLRATLQRAQSRIPVHFASDGSQPEELRRTATAHYCLFNLQSWMNLLRIGRRTGLLRPDFAAEPWCRLARAVTWILDRDLTAWPYTQITPFAPDRAYPLAAAALENGIDDLGRATGRFTAREVSAARPRLDPHDGVPPWWALTHDITQAT
jgi:hypothetical protein